MFQKNMHFDMLFVVFNITICTCPLKCELYCLAFHTSSWYYSLYNWYYSHADIFCHMTVRPHAATHIDTVFSKAAEKVSGETGLKLLCSNYFINIKVTDPI